MSTAALNGTETLQQIIKTRRVREGNKAHSKFLWMKELKIMECVPKKGSPAFSYLKNKFFHQSATGFAGASVRKFETAWSHGLGPPLGSGSVAMRSSGSGLWLHTVVVSTVRSLSGMADYQAILFPGEVTITV